ncbi:MAG TPA: hypothetical protein VF609_12395 [Flavisolibacter sp.]
MRPVFLSALLFTAFYSSSQNVGIGTNVPLQKLHVAGKAIVDSLGIGIPSPQAPLQFSNLVANRKIVLYDDLLNNHQFYGFGINPGQLRYQTALQQTDHTFYSGYSADSSVELLRIKGTGNVGIGTATPTAKLDVAGKGKFNGDLILTSNDPGGTWLYLNNTSGAATGWKLVSSGTATPGGAGNLYVYDAANNAAVTVLANGNTGIGNSTPAEKLEVNGNIKTTGYIKAGHVIVSTNYMLPANSNTIQQCSCPPNTTLIGGGGGNITMSDVQIRGVSVSYSGPDLDPAFSTVRWTLLISNATAFAAQIRAYAICARIGN